MRYSQPVQTDPGVKAVTALPPSSTSPGLTGQWKAQNSRTTDYHTAPSLASRCQLMGSWKVKMKSGSLSVPSHFLPPSICCQWQMSQFLSVWLSLPFLSSTSPQVRLYRTQGAKEIQQRRTGVMKIIKTVRLFQRKYSTLNLVYCQKILLCSLNQG